jgi:hypothetical protein
VCAMRYSDTESYRAELDKLSRCLS